MAATLVSGNIASTVAAALTRYFAWGSGNLGVPNATESVLQRALQTAGVISNFWIRVVANSLDGTTTHRIRKNGADGNSVVTFLTTVTGTAEDTTHSDTFAAGDTVNHSIVTGGTTGTIQTTIAACLFAATTNTTVPIIAVRAAGRDFTTDSTDFFPEVNGDITAGTTEASRQIKMRKAAVVAFLTVRLLTNTRGTTTNVRVRKNGANGTGLCAVTAATTGLIQDTTHSDSFAVDDLFGYMLSTSTGGGSFLVSIIASDITSTAGVGYLISGATLNITQGTTVYTQVNGALIGTATEASTQIKALAAGVISNFAAYSPANTASGTSTLRLRVNAGDGNSVVTFAGGVTGYAEDTTHSDTVAATDAINTSIAVAAGGTQLSISTITMVITYATGGAAAAPRYGMVGGFHEMSGGL